MESLYGDSSARNAVFAESATQLRLEAAAVQNDTAGRLSALPAAQVRPPPRVAACFLCDALRNICVERTLRAGTVGPGT